jgi:acyl-coenzyme A thioesterase PaaI-like protein
MSTTRLPLCAGCTISGRCQFGVTAYELDGDGVARARVWVDEAMEGGPRVAHGGWTSAIFDEVLGKLPNMHGVLAVTKTLTVDYTRPVPVGRWLLGEARVDSRADGAWEISGVLLLESTRAVLARAHGVWLERTGQHFQRHKEWLRDQDTAAGQPG